MQVGVGHLEAGDGQARARHAECRFLGETNRARHLHEVRRDVRGGIGPRLIGAAWDDQDMPGRGGFNRGERDAQVVGPHEAAGPDARDDVFKNSAHATIVTYLCSLRWAGASSDAGGCELPW